MRKFIWQGGGILSCEPLVNLLNSQAKPDRLSPFSSANPIFYLSCYIIFLIDFQKTPLKFTFICKKLFLKQVLVLSHNQLRNITKIILHLVIYHVEYANNNQNDKMKCFIFNKSSKNKQIIYKYNIKKTMFEQ